MSCWFCTFKAGSIFPVWLMFLLLLSNPASSCCHCLLAAQFQARSVPGKLLWVSVVCHIFCYGRPFFTSLAHPWWTSMCSQQGCKVCKSQRRTPLSLAPNPSGGVQIPVVLHFSPFGGGEKSIVRPGLLFTSISDSVTPVCWGDFCTLLEKKGGEDTLFLVSEAQSSQRKT